MKLTDLIGLRIDSAYRCYDSVFLVCDTGRIVRLAPEGECCADAFIQHIDNAQALFAAEVIGVEDLVHTPTMLAAIEAAENVKLRRKSGEAYDIWGHRIVTTAGTCVLDCRTSHNGCYSGSLEVTWADAIPVRFVLLEDA